MGKSASDDKTLFYPLQTKEERLSGNGIRCLLTMQRSDRLTANAYEGRDEMANNAPADTTTTKQTILPANGNRIVQPATEA